MNYRSYKKFNENLFRDEHKNTLLNIDNASMNREKFKDIFMQILNKYAPMKKKCIRGNNAPFMNKTLCKAFMHRSKLKNRLNKIPTEDNKRLYKRQRNFCVSLLEKEKRNYYNNLDLKIFDDNKTFWQRIKPLFSDKMKAIGSDIILVENEIITSDNKEVAEKCNTFFNEAVENLDIELFLTENMGDRLTCNLHEKLDKYDEHPSIKKINENVKLDIKFSFSDITFQEFENEILKFDIKKAV